MPAAVLSQLPGQPSQVLTGRTHDRTTVIVSTAQALPQPRLGPAKGEQLYAVVAAASTQFLGHAVG